MLKVFLFFILPSCVFAQNLPSGVFQTPSGLYEIRIDGFCEFQNCTYPEIHVDSEGVSFGFYSVLAEGSGCDHFLSGDCYNASLINETGATVSAIFDAFVLNVMSEDGWVRFNVSGGNSSMFEVVLTYPPLPVPDNSLSIAILAVLCVFNALFCCCSLGLCLLILQRVKRFVKEVCCCCCRCRCHRAVSPTKESKV